MKKIKGLISVLMTLVTVILVFACTQMSASAASTAAFDKLSTSTYAKTYTLSSSGTTKPYTSKNLTTRGSVTYGSSSTAYIDNASDELYVFDVGKNSSGKYYAYVSYPISSSKRAKAYIPLSAITSNNGSHKAVTSTGKFYCSTRSNNSTSKSYYVDKGDKVYLIATKDSKYQIMYPNSSGMWRIAWCSKTDYNKYCASSPTTSSSSSSTTTALQYPMKKAKITVNWAERVNYMPKSRNAHLALDFIPNGDNNVYAMANGTIQKAGENGANGKYIIIKHTISGKTVYSFYAHLKSYIKSSGSVKAGEKIGVVGATGSSSNGVIHLHFSIVSSVWTSGGYYGYSPSFSGNKTTYQGVTYYNPEYVIKNGKLPS